MPAHTRIHTLKVQPPTVCRMCSEATRVSGGESSIGSLPTISSVDQRAAKQTETTVGAKGEHAQQYN